MFAHAEEARRQALISAGTGKALEGRDLAAVELLDSSLWLPEVQQCWSRHHDVARLSGAALRLRVTPMGASSSSSGGVAAAPAPEARDWQVLGRVVPVRLLLSPWAAVLQSYASSAVLESRSTAGIHPAVHGAMMNQASTRPPSSGSGPRRVRRRRRSTCGSPRTSSPRWRSTRWGAPGATISCRQRPSWSVQTPLWTRPPWSTRRKCSR
ncbi:unnamed protein product, partial [Prorocentrum cordatum]